jgi:hypothetical protein
MGLKSVLRQHFTPMLAGQSRHMQSLVPPIQHFPGVQRPYHCLCDLSVVSCMQGAVRRKSVASLAWGPIVTLTVAASFQKGLMCLTVRLVSDYSAHWWLRLGNMHMLSCTRSLI